MAPPGEPRDHPYRGRPARSHWRSIADARHPLDIGEWYARKFSLQGARIGTAGSCFAQHIGRELRAKGFDYVDVEPAPAMLDASLHGDYGYGIYSARYGNIYTTRQLLQLLQRALGEFTPVEGCWTLGNGVVDPFRPTIEPAPLPDRDELEELRRHHLAAVAGLFERIDVFVFTMGLTEAWVDTRDGAVFPVAPGVAGGQWDPATCRFVNFQHHMVRADLEAFIARARLINPDMRFILTVSPVPLMATMTGQHVAAATMYSKSVLRAVAGAVSDKHRFVDYFPSYEIIASPVMRGQFYESDMRAVNRSGVDHVMKQFFAEHEPPRKRAAPAESAAPAPEPDPDLVCDEELLATFGGPQ